MSSLLKATKFYATTPIFYVNAAPHIGHLYSAVIADAAVRYQKLRQPNVKILFSTGTDEHGAKIQQAAAQNNQDVGKYCDQISSKFRSLFDSAEIQYTHYNRTSDKVNHFPAVQAFWKTLEASGNIYQSDYSGWYCVSDETFLTESQLTTNNKNEKVSIESGHPVQWFKETNYMFRLSNYQDEVIRWIERKNPVKPTIFQKILLSILREEIGDISVSRPSNRVSWAVPVPNDESQTIYVWLDALINYLTSAGYPNESFRENWPPHLHVIGKDILKFHAIYWPAFLMAAKLDLPEQILVHSHWMVDDHKMSKSRGNVVCPTKAAKRYTMEGLRYFLLRGGVAHSDGNYSDTKATRYLNAELVGTYGNLLSRTCGKAINKHQVVPSIDQDQFEQIRQTDKCRHLIEQLTEMPQKCATQFDEFNFHLVVDEVIRSLHLTNEFMQEMKPWELKADESQRQKLNTILAIILESLRLTSIILQPILPSRSAFVLDKINVPSRQRTWGDLTLNLSSQQERPLADGSAIVFSRIN